ncbi:hypothetical protein K2X05_06500 [bacterium]|nr:hypothetical protein [bacterium]
MSTDTDLGAKNNQDSRALIIYKNFLLFLFKGASCVSLSTSISVSISDFLIDPSKFFVDILFYVAFSSFVLGFISAFIGFWALFLFKNKQDLDSIAYPVATILGIICIGIMTSWKFYFGIFDPIHVLIFPVAPLIACVAYFRFLVQKHIFILRLNDTHLSDEQRV